jgi:hypothetical protein
MLGALARLRIDPDLDLTLALEEAEPQEGGSEGASGASTVVGRSASRLVLRGARSRRYYGLC